MSGPVATVNVSDPLSGVKRSALSGGGVPSQLPAKRGRIVEPGGAVRAPGIRNGNRPNRGTNVTIPYARVSPLRFLDESSGVRLSPGDVAFVRKKPEGEIDARDYMMEKDGNLNKTKPGDTKSDKYLLPQQARWRRQAQRSKEIDGVDDFLKKMSNHDRSEFGAVPQRRIASSHTHRVVGLDGMNEMLRGGPGNTDMRVGVNVLEVTDPSNDFLPGPYGFLRKLEMLDEYALDGVILSNDEPDSFGSNGIRDNVLFNIAVQGKALLNNGFLEWTELDPSEQVSKLAFPKEGVEARPRVTRDHMVQMNPSVARSRAWNGANANAKGYGNDLMYGNSSFDFVADFNGQYTAYPLQMFDRNPMVGVNMYVGLRAVRCTESMNTKLRDRDGAVYQKTEGASYYYFQYMPYSQRICDLIELTSAAGMLNNNKNPYPLALIVAGAHNSSSRMVNTGLEKDPFAPIKSADWRMMVGTWTVGTVIDTSAARHGQFNSGPPDTSFQCMVNVHVTWMERQHDKHGEAQELFGKPTVTEEKREEALASTTVHTQARTTTNLYNLAPNAFQTAEHNLRKEDGTAQKVQAALHPRASKLREEMIFLRGLQQNPSMTARVGTMMVINPALMTQNNRTPVDAETDGSKLSLMEKPTLVLGSGLNTETTKGGGEGGEGLGGGGDGGGGDGGGGEGLGGEGRGGEGLGGGGDGGGGDGGGGDGGGGDGGGGDGGGGEGLGGEGRGGEGLGGGGDGGGGDGGGGDGGGGDGGGGDGGGGDGGGGDGGGGEGLGGGGEGLGGGGGGDGGEGGENEANEKEKNEKEVSIARIKAAPAPAPAPAPAKMGKRARRKMNMNQESSSKYSLEDPLFGEDDVSEEDDGVVKRTYKLMDAPMVPTAASPLVPAEPPATATRAAVGGAAAARAPQSRASTAAPPVASTYASSMTSTVSSVFGNLFSESSTPAPAAAASASTSAAAVPRSPSPTPSSGSNESGLPGPRAFTRRSRS